MAQDDGEPMSRLIAEWKVAAKDLGIEVIAPFTLDLGSGERVRFPVRVCSFGGSEGMLIFSDFDRMKPWLDEA